MPTWLRKEACDTVAPLITLMCNTSITQDKFPNSQKSAIVRPLIKKVNFDPSDLNSYRPISNLSFVSKLLEQIIDVRFTKHVNTNNLFSPLRSAYRKHHSTETALVKNNTIANIDQGLVGALMFLDVSPA